MLIFASCSIYLKLFKKFSPTLRNCWFCKTTRSVTQSSEKKWPRLFRLCSSLSEAQRKQRLTSIAGTRSHPIFSKEALLRQSLMSNLSLALSPRVTLSITSSVRKLSLRIQLPYSCYFGTHINLLVPDFFNNIK